MDDIHRFRVSSVKNKVLKIENPCMYKLCRHSPGDNIAYTCRLSVNGDLHIVFLLTHLLAIDLERNEFTYICQLTY